MVAVTVVAFTSVALRVVVVKVPLDELKVRLEPVCAFLLPVASVVKTT